MQNPKAQHYKAIASLVATAVMWSLAGVLIKQVNCNPITIAGIRSGVAFAFMLTFVRKRHLTFSMPQIAGAIFYSLTMLIFVAATTLTTAANAIVLQYTAPIYIALLGHWFLKERTSPVEWLTVIAAVTGVVMFFLDELSTGGVWGNILGIGTGLTFALSILCFRKQKDASPIGSMFLGNALTLLIATPFIITAPPADAPSWGILAILGVVQLGLPYVLYAWAIKRVTALEAIMIPAVEPILNPLWVALFIGEMPGKWAVPGAIIVICSAAACASIRIVSMRSVQEAGKTS